MSRGDAGLVADSHVFDVPFVKEVYAKNTSTVWLLEMYTIARFSDLKTPKSSIVHCTACHVRIAGTLRLEYLITPAETWRDACVL